MIPSNDQRLASMIRAVEDVILPALADHSGLAVEQTHLLLGHLHILRQNADHAVAYEAAEARALTALGRELVQQADGGPATEAAAKVLEDCASGPESNAPGQVRALIERISLAVEDLVEASGEDGTDEFKSASAASIIRAGREQSMRDRSWSAAAGFETADADLIPFDELVAGLGT